MIFGGTMNKELLKADIESVLSDKYEITADKAQPISCTKHFHLR